MPGLLLGNMSASGKDVLYHPQECTVLLSRVSRMASWSHCLAWQAVNADEHSGIGDKTDLLWDTGDSPEV